MLYQLTMFAKIIHRHWWLGRLEESNSRINEMAFTEESKNSDEEGEVGIVVCDVRETPCVLSIFLKMIKATRTR